MYKTKKQKKDKAKQQGKNTLGTKTDGNIDTPVEEFHEQKESLT